MDESSLSHIHIPSSDDDYDEELGYISEDESDDDSGGSRARFRAATLAMESRHDSFTESQPLYDFLYEFRDVIGLVMDDSVTFLHAAIRFVKENRDAHSGSIMPLIESIAKEHPNLLRQEDSDGVTPLYMAICTRRPLLIEALLSGCAEYPEWKSAVQDSIEIRCVPQKSKTCLHIAFELAIRERVVIKLIQTAREEAFALQDEDGRTPLHYAIDGRRPSLAAAHLLIQRDDEILNKRGFKGTSNHIQTFVDIIDKEGNSAYRHHLVMKEKKRSLARERSSEVQTVLIVRKAIEKTERGEKQPTPDRGHQKVDPGYMYTKQKQRILDRRREKADQRRAGSQKEESQTVDSGQVINKQEKLDEKRRKQDQATTQERNEMMKELKLHYMRTRNTAMAVLFLYGSNSDDIELNLDLHGLPAKVEATPFQDFISSLKFDETLQSVSLPDIQVQFKRRPQSASHNDSKHTGKERRDLQFIFDCLQARGVRHIIRVDVEDSREFPHSNRAISECFNTITVEQFNWNKVDLDPRVICNLGSHITWGRVAPDSSTTFDSQIREVTLCWSGNNTALRAWSEPEGLPLLPRLRRITILVPAKEEMTESPDWVSACLVEFRQRIARNSSTEASSSVAMEEHQNDNGSKSDDSPEIESRRKDIDIRVVWSEGEAQGQENLQILDRPVESRSGYRWLDTVYGFADIIKQLWHLSVDKASTDISKQAVDDVVVALIDDGVDVYGSSVSENIIGGKSFALNNGNNMPKPFFVSESGHGTLMAEAIKRVCPMVKIYPIRVNTEGSKDKKLSVEQKSVILAFQTAINRKADIILIPWHIQVTEFSPQEESFLEHLVEKASNQGILMFVPSDGNNELHSSFNLRPNVVFRIGEAREDGSFTFFEDADFMFPGGEVIARHDIEKPRPFNDRMSNGNIVSTTVNVSLAAGLAASLIYAFRLVLRKRTAGTLPTSSETAEKDYPSHSGILQGHQGMMKAFQHLGSVTPGRFLRVWESLDPIIDEMKDVTGEEQELEHLSQWFSQLGDTEDR